MAVLKAAANFLGLMSQAREEVKSDHVLLLADRWLEWVDRREPPSRSEITGAVVVRPISLRAVDRTTTKPLLDLAGRRHLVRLASGVGVRYGPHSCSANCVGGVCFHLTRIASD